MSDTQLIAIAIALATIINQWLLAIFKDKAAKQAAPDANPVSSVPRKAKRNLHEYVFAGGDFILFAASVYLMWDIISTVGANGVPSVKVSTLLSFLAVAVCFNGYQLLSSLLRLVFR